MKREFCHNSRRWISLMVFKGRPPNSCPYADTHFMDCGNCAYWELKEETSYIKKIMEILHSYEKEAN